MPPPRPWPAPASPPSMHQAWLDLLFAHWPVDSALLRPLLPRGLSLDTHAGAAWVGLVPFRMTVRLRALPPLPFAHAFPELNVRTYCTAHDRPGVWFLSLDAASLPVVAAARRWFRLPYFHARMECRADGDGVAYRSRRVHRGAPPAVFSARYRPLGPARPAEPGSLDHFLTERYCLYTAAADGGLLRAEVDHPPWELQPAEAEITEDTMLASHGLPVPPVAPRLLFARRQVVRAWAPTRVSE